MVQSEYRLAIIRFSIFMEPIFIMLDIEHRMEWESEREFRHRTWSATVMEIKRIESMEAGRPMTELALIIERLLKERDIGENEEMLLLVVCAKNKPREVMESLAFGQEIRDNG